MKRYWIAALICLILAVSLAAGMPEWTSAQISGKAMDQRTKEAVMKREGMESRRERDPFLLPQGIEPLSALPRGLPSKRDDKPGEIPLPSLEVRAILISDRLRLASVDHQIVAVGDLIRDEKVLEIQKDRVVMGKGDKKRSLLLKQSPVRLTVEESERKGENR